MESNRNPCGAGGAPAPCVRPGQRPVCAVGARARPRAARARWRHAPAPGPRPADRRPTPHAPRRPRRRASASPIRRPRARPSAPSRGPRAACPCGRTDPRGSAPRPPKVKVRALWLSLPATKRSKATDGSGGGGGGGGRGGGGGGRGGGGGGGRRRVRTAGSLVASLASPPGLAGACGHRCPCHCRRRCLHGLHGLLSCHLLSEPICRHAGAPAQSHSPVLPGSAARDCTGCTWLG